jgi:hypothetical protein
LYQSYHVTIPKSVIDIYDGAFANCTNLTSVTFQGMINADNFGVQRVKWNLPFNGDLRDKYLAKDGGPGTYKRFAGGEVWRKQ